MGSDGEIALRNGNQVFALVKVPLCDEDSCFIPNPPRHTIVAEILKLPGSEGDIAGQNIVIIGRLVGGDKGCILILVPVVFPRELDNNPGGR